MQPFGINERVLCGGNDLDVFQPRIGQALRDKFRRPIDVAFVFRQRADAGNSQKREQLIQNPISILLDKCSGGRGHDSIIRRWCS